MYNTGTILATTKFSLTASEKLALHEKKERELEKQMLKETRQKLIKQKNSKRKSQRPGMRGKRRNSNPGAPGDDLSSDFNQTNLAQNGGETMPIGRHGDVESPRVVYENGITVAVSKGVPRNNLAVNAILTQKPGIFINRNRVIMVHQLYKGYMYLLNVEIE